MLNILITGANGQLGNHMRLLGATAADRYIFTDVAELDITDRDAIRRAATDGKIDIIVNCAAYTNVDRAEEDAATADLLNRAAAENLAIVAKEVGATLIHISTDYVFDGNHCTPYREDAPTAPLGIYGVTKLAGERAVVASGCRYFILRTAWLYSEYGRNFLKTMLQLTSEREALKVVFDQVGSPTYAGDLAAAVFHIINSGAYATAAEGIYHFTDEGVCSWYDFATEIAASAHNDKCRIAPCHSDEFPSKVTRPHYSVLDKTKIRDTFGIEIPHWRTSLVRCIANLTK